MGRSTVGSRLATGLGLGSRVVGLGVGLGHCVGLGPGLGLGSRLGMARLGLGRQCTDRRRRSVGIVGCGVTDGLG